MAESEDARRLRALWNREALSQYEGKWIAFRKGEVEASEASNEVLLSRYLDEIKEHRGPLFAYVYFGVMQ
ncbi:MULTISPECIES: hypothetical protein [unclassified Mesorhizobium]|uniref:hypothetical protein n=1 Tax=unclassified Mesorhizobium TaxID=325217 RepID=UPI001129F3B1|nr:MULTISPECIES: hypothetical protein [unclassified Mesorhizobium]TPM99519.1 hypothetical protein FJ977_08960 [Mesorhizobium sp. B2-1-3A]BCG84460.1 hypothetical protein MesoLj113c_05700 [Mesorhizobium sp. 113-3-9]